MSKNTEDKIMERIKRLEREISELEKKLDKDHFGELFNKEQHKKELNRLAKLKKELEKLTGKK
jgi:uncharacterized protein (UPF0335 family)